MMASGGSVNLPPGFCFSPTDEELIVHFLYSKASLPFHPNIMPDLDLSQLDPWELNGIYVSIFQFFNIYRSDITLCMHGSNSISYINCTQKTKKKKRNCMSFIVSYIYIYIYALTQVRRFQVEINTISSPK